MALRSRHRQIEAWPGYVDVLSTLLMVIVFVLMIFVIGQLFLSQALSGRDEALAKLNRQIAEMADILSLRVQETSALKTQVDDLSGALTKSTAERDELRNQLVVVIGERDTLQAQVGDLQKQMKSSSDQVAAQAALTAEAQKKLEEAYKSIEADRAKINALLTDVAALESLRDELMKKIGNYETEKEELSTEAQKRVELLNQQILALRQQLAEHQRRRWTIAETKAKEQDVQIAELGKRLNTALASKVAGAGALPLRVLRPPARDPRRPRGHPDRRRPLRVPLGRVLRQRFGGARAGGPRPARRAGDHAHPAAAARSRRRSTGCCASTATPTTGRSTRRNSPPTGSCRPRAPSRW